MKPTMLSSLVLRLFSFSSVQSQDSFHCVSRIAAYAPSWVGNLKISLQKRGVVVWLDKDAIRPGDLFAQALENGIKDSRAIAIIVTPQSMKSKWVQEEYYRALSLAHKKEDKYNSMHFAASGDSWFSIK